MIGAKPNMRSDNFPKFKISDSMKYQFETVGKIEKEEWNDFLENNNVISVISLENPNLKDFSEKVEKLKEEDTKPTHFWSYFRGGQCYRINFSDGRFYIGSTIRENIEDYYGSGASVTTIYENENVSYEKIIIKDDFHNEYDLRLFEKELIEYYSGNKNCVNKTSGLQRLESKSTCSYCFGSHRKHYKGCPNFPICEECGESVTNHKPTCSQAKVCDECGGLGGHHKKKCSQRKYKKDVVSCQECGAKYNHHKKWCSKRTETGTCPECFGKWGHHKKSCPFYKKRKTCEICGSVVHKSDCPKVKKCEKCNGVNGHHKKNCPLFQPSEIICGECGGKSGKHKKNCSKYKGAPVCEICGSKGWTHKSSCPKYVKPKGSCEFCGTPPGGKHKKECPEFVQIICDECGAKSNRHFKWCSRKNELKAGLCHGWLYNENGV